MYQIKLRNTCYQKAKKQKLKQFHFLISCKRYQKLLTLFLIEFTHVNWSQLTLNPLDGFTLPFMLALMISLQIGEDSSSFFFSVVYSQSGMGMSNMQTTQKEISF